jgi:uncharacterized protein YegP (UPF0339 family)
VKFEIYLNRGQYFFRLRAGNGRTLLNSIAFPDKESCLSALIYLQKTSADGSRYERKKVGLKEQLVMVDAERNILAYGSMYSSPASYEQGLYTLSTFCRIAAIVDINRIISAK